MAIILSSLLYARALSPSAAPHAPPFSLSLLWAVWTLIDEPYVRTMDGRDGAGKRGKSQRYIRTVSLSSLCLISCITAAPFHLAVSHMLEAGDTLEFCYRLRLLQLSDFFIIILLLVPVLLVLLLHNLSVSMLMQYSACVRVCH